MLHANNLLFKFFAFDKQTNDGRAELKQWQSKAFIFNLFVLSVIIIFSLILKLFIPGIIVFFLLPFVFIYMALINAFYFLGYIIVKAILFINPDISRYLVLSVVWICVFFISGFLTFILSILFIINNIP